MNQCGGCSKKQEKAPQACPLCQQESAFAHQLVVQSVAKEGLKPLIVEENYYVCSNSQCEVVFFDEGKEQILLVEDVDLTADFSSVTKGERSCSTCTVGCGAGGGCSGVK